MARPYDICIRGAGIVGRTLALHLASKRLRVALVSAPGNPAGHSDVRAYALNQSSKTLLEAVRCWPDAPHATAVVSMQVHGDEGGEVAFSATEQGVDALNWIVDVPVLEKLLTEAVRFQPLIEVVETPQTAALTVVCEGRASRTREEFGVDFDVTPYDQWAVAARVQCEQPHDQVARQWFSQGEVLAFLPLDGAAGNLCALVWSVSAERAPLLQAMSPDTFCETLQTASHGALGALTLASERHTWPLQQAQARRWSGTSAQGAWVLAGDAAHTVHPLAGQGLNLGLADVAELVRLLDGRAYWRSVGDTRLLRQYERARKADLALVGNTGDALQQLFAHAHPSLQTLRNWGMNQFERSGLIKHWVARRAMGTTANPPPSPNREESTAP
ncbi:FAD-dependent monooxygenase [Rhodoferax saidenbachensis]|uniref:Ubiquinone biosynthesis protein UbiH n=1 Tax=Rhodoferax saidenbachensis TaxID=1484693 RepID=A0A1P8KG14_9BURK|nr:FAD-dependent monooxygenase [Rhodoferax saidenbachensis]APW44939.1 ubiquinone biosynthesis protein UbiH [Rhodoferax saidenbachensis]